MGQTKFTAFTLLELIIAMVLLVIIMLGFVSIDLFSRHHLFTADKRTKLQNELSLIAEHISKDVMRSTGDINNPGLFFGTTPAPYNENMLVIRIDQNNTPGDYSDDLLVGYARDGRVNHAGEVFYCPDTNYNHRAGEDGGEVRHQVLARHIPTNAFNATLILDPVSGTPIGVNVNITARENISQPASLDNPEVNMRSTAYSRSTSTR
jgi:hypothetical protein